MGRQVPLLEKIDSIRGQALREQERQLFEDIKRRLMEDHHIATGPQAVIDAIENDQIGYSGCVVMESDPGEIASRCSACHKLFRRGVDECPSCRARCEKTNLWQAIALFAVRKHVVVHFVEPGHGLDKHAGVVALLARPSTVAHPSTPLGMTLSSPKGQGEAPWNTPPERVLTGSLPERRA
jgi:hypothetical protein